jgi:hypothetical protein
VTVRNDIDARLSINSSIGAQAVASSTTVHGTSVNLAASTSPHDARVMAVCSVGSRTDGTFTFALEDSADNSSFAAVTLLAGSLAAISAADTDKTASYIPVAGRPYVRVSVTSTTVTSGGVVAAYTIVAPNGLI